MCLCATAARLGCVCVYFREEFVYSPKGTDVPADGACQFISFLFSCLISSSIVPGILSEVLDLARIHLWIFFMSVLCRYVKFLHLFLSSLLAASSMLWEKESGLRGFEIQKLGCKIILESVNNTKIKCTSISSVYFYFEQGYRLIHILMWLVLLH